MSQTMFNLKFLFLCLVALASVHFTQAQDFLPFPPKDPKIFFGDSVEVLDIELSAFSPQQLSSRAFLVRYDNSNRVVVTSDNVVFPVPWGGGYTQVFVLRVQDGLVYGRRIREPEAQGRWMQGYSPDYEDYWRLELATGEWTIYAEDEIFLDTPCGTFNLERISRTAEWILVTGLNRQQHLCRLANGIHSPPLPQGYEDWHLDYNRERYEYVFMRVLKTINDVLSHVVYIYTPSLRTTTLVGEFPITNLSIQSPETNCDVFYLPQALPDASIYLDMTSSCNQGASRSRRYVLRVLPGEQRTEPLSLNTRYEPNPPRLVTRQMTLEDGLFACSVTSQNLETQETITYRIHSPCRYWHEDGYDYYRVVTTDRSSATAVRVDVATAETDILYSGEIEDILWASQDGRYAAFVLDSNGRIDVSPRNTYPFRSGPSQDAKAVLIDLVSETVLYEQQVFAVEPPAPGPWSTRVQLYEGNVIEFGGAYDTTLITLTSDGIETMTTEGSLGEPLGDDWAFLYPPFGSGEEQIELYDLGTQCSIPLISLGEYERDAYISQVNYLGTDQFTVTVLYDTSQYGDLSQPLFPVATYTVEVRDRICPQHP
jgi:hypothetical protein